MLSSLDNWLSRVFPYLELNIPKDMPFANVTTSDVEQSGIV